MKRIIAYVIGAALIVLGAIALFGAFEDFRAGGTTDRLAQEFLAPISLFIVGGFAIWMGRQTGRRG
ncbi:MAG: hypothetical protein D6801_06100 [Alphaproteobacteria bacterium]|nr:MAG: hypothetical protein D6801_06100 [Alphaproteobacteria bacterium]